MHQVFAKTRELGQALMESEVYQKMKAAEDKAMQNKEAADTMAKYLELRGQVQDLLSGENPDSGALKKLSDEMDAQQEKLQMMDDIVAMNEARAEFTNLINQVNQVLQFIVTGRIDSDENSSSCTGSCSTCSGCKH